MNDIQVHVIDYGIGNLGSIMNMFRRIGVNAKLTSNKDEILQAARILIPGVGAFDTGMQNLERSDLVEVLNEKVIRQKTPVLGICLGMQLMSKSSQEGELPGLGWLDADTIDMRRAANNSNLKFPHVGWNYIEPKKNHFLCTDFLDDPRFYFVHSFMVKCNNEENVLATAYYGSLEVTAMVVNKNIVGAQFHPEKSHRFGMQLLRNFSIWMPNDGA